MKFKGCITTFSIIGYQMGNIFSSLYYFRMESIVKRFFVNVADTIFVDMKVNVFFIGQK